MFVHMKKLSAKSADALDLIIEFATLGEYGLECPEGATGSAGRSCHEGRRHTAATRLRSSRTTPSTNCPTGNSDFAAALRPPRIKLRFTE